MSKQSLSHHTSSLAANDTWIRSPFAGQRHKRVPPRQVSAHITHDVHSISQVGSFVRGHITAGDASYYHFTSFALAIGHQTPPPSPRPCSRRRALTYNSLTAVSLDAELTVNIAVPVCRLQDQHRIFHFLSFLPLLTPALSVFVSTNSGLNI